MFARGLFRPIGEDIHPAILMCERILIYFRRPLTGPNPIFILQGPVLLGSLVAHNFSRWTEKRRPFGVVTTPVT
jgi:hypothetical protein